MRGFRAAADGERAAPALEPGALGREVAPRAAGRLVFGVDLTRLDAVFLLGFFATAPVPLRLSAPSAQPSARRAATLKS